MKKGLLLLLALVTLKADAQYSFTGIVRDQSTGHSVSGASITLQGPVLKGQTTGKEGHFFISGLKAGNYHLEVSYLGYQHFISRIRVDSSVNNYRILLENRGLFVQPVEITSSRVGKDAPFTTTEVSGKELQKINLGQDLPYLLDQSPSVVVNSDAGAGVGYTGIHIRGTDETRINVTINGIPVNDAEDQGVYWVDIPDLASSTGSIQIQRGVGGSTNGAGAFGATINVSTDDYHDSAYGEVSNSYGSFNTWKHTIQAGTGLLGGHFTLDARASKITSDGYIDRASSNLESGYLSAAYFTPSTSIRLNIFTGKEKTYQAWNGVPQDSLKTNPTYNGLGLEPDGSYYPNQTDNYEQDYYQLFIDHQVSHNLNFNTAFFLTRGFGYYEEFLAAQSYSAYGVQPPVFGTDTLATTDLTQQLWLSNYYYGTIFSLNHSNKGSSWSLGGGWNQYLGWHYGFVNWARDGGFPPMYRWYYDFADKNELNLYWRGQQTFASYFHGYVDMQWRNVAYHINGFDDNPTLLQRNWYNFFDPKAGILVNPRPGEDYYVSFAVAHKEPNRDDYEANETQTPKPETLEDLEAGFDRKTSRYAFHGGFYYMYYINQLVLTGKINDVGAYTRTNTPYSYRMGLELSGEMKFARIFQLSANLTISSNKILRFTEYIDNYDSGKQDSIYHGTTDISFSPGLIGAATLTANPVRNLEIAWMSKYVGKQFMDNTSNPGRSLDAYFLNGMRISYSWHPGWINAVQFTLLVNNLFSVKYANNGYTYTYVSGGQPFTDNSYFPQAGINYLTGVDFLF
ncbi:MAG TPA: carboxypeptidase regulatory-like domain-containing protein [Chitinophagaceae bacterium]|nr:carboxypeptidase regulatory-like domain-containing protein [Chitinophagaceae bacterium]